VSDTRRPAAMRARECRERGPECVLRHVTMKKRNKRVSVLKISESVPFRLALHHVPIHDTRGPWVTVATPLATTRAPDDLARDMQVLPARRV
jgi:hypothetical protein